MVRSGGSIYIPIPDPYRNSYSDPSFYPNPYLYLNLNLYVNFISVNPPSLFPVSIRCDSSPSELLLGEE